MKKLEFGDRIMNIAASERNPIKYGRFVRKGFTKGFINKGPYVEYICDKGNFHRTPPDNIVAVEQQNNK